MLRCHRNQDGLNDVFICKTGDAYNLFHGSASGFVDVTSTVVPAGWNAVLQSWLGCYGKAPSAADFNEVDSNILSAAPLPLRFAGTVLTV